MRRDAYEVLGVERGADERAIKKAFRVVARELHPDVNSDDPEAEAKFKEAAEAYEVLSDPERKAVYDRHGWDGVDSKGYASQAQGFGSFGDIFDAFFGGDPFGGGRGGPRAVQGGDVGVEVEITLEQAARGIEVEVSYDAVEPCEHCHGNGAEPGTPIETCERCGGTGELRAVSNTAFGQLVRAQACDVCGGEGKVAQTPCGECVGPRAQGGPADADGGPPGRHRRRPARPADRPRPRRRPRRPGGRPLRAACAVAEDERFLRDGNDLISVVDVPAPAAALGTTVTVPTLDGEEEVGCEAGTQPGTVVTLRGKGMPSVGRGRGRTGDQQVVLNVVIPRNLTDRQRELLGELRDSVTEDNLREAASESLLSKVKRALR